MLPELVRAAGVRRRVGALADRLRVMFGSNSTLPAVILLLLCALEDRKVYGDCGLSGSSVADSVRVETFSRGVRDLVLR